MKIIYHNDGGHGWYAVKRKKLESMGILNNVSGFSYERGETVYLEEDCDASLFFNALSEEEKATIKVIDSYQDRSPVRSYSRFTKRVKNLETKIDIYNDQFGPNDEHVVTLKNEVKKLDALILDLMVKVQENSVKRATIA